MKSNVKKIILEKNIKRLALAKKINSSPSTIDKICHDKYIGTVTLDVLGRAARELDVKIKDLFEE